MKNIIILFSFLLFINCGDDTIENDCFSDISISGTVNLDLPQFINLKDIPGGSASANISNRNVLIILGPSRYVAFDSQCPEGDCNSDMTFDGTFITCPCTGKTYNYLQGGSPIDGDGCFALEYNVLQSNSSTLQISR